MRWHAIAALLLTAASVACTPVMQIGESKTLTRPRAQQWTYWCTTPGRKLTAFLNDVGRRGWELTATQTTDGAVVWCFKPPTAEAPVMEKPDV
jgi:hypothetical protein